MKGAVICFFVLAAVVFARPNEKYTDIYDSTNLEEFKQNTKLLLSVINCILDKGKCSPAAKELKVHIVDALQTNCSKCTEVQRDGVENMIGHLINKEPGHWRDLVAKYDPTGEYTAKYEKELKAVKQ